MSVNACAQDLGGGRLGTLTIDWLMTHYWWTDFVQVKIWQLSSLFFDEDLVKLRFEARIVFAGAHKFFRDLDVFEISLVLQHENSEFMHAFLHFQSFSFDSLRFEPKFGLAFFAAEL